jgi:hypothetical protein
MSNFEKIAASKSLEKADFSYLLVCLILLAFACIFMKNAFTAEYYEDEIMELCFSNGLIAISAIVIFFKTANFPKIRLLAVFSILVPVLMTAQIVILRSNCKVIEGNAKYYKWETIYNLAQNSVLTDKNGNKYVELEIGSQSNMKSYLYVSKYNDFEIIRIDDETTPYLDCKVYEKISTLVYGGDKNGTLYSLCMLNPLARRLMQIKNSDEYYYKVVYLN